MAGKDPAFLFYSKDWLEGTAEMTPDEKGVYVDLLAHQHQKGSLPPETKRLAKLAGISESEFLLIWKDLATKFLPNGSGRLVNRKLNGIVSERQDKGWRNKIIGTLASIIRYSGQTYETNAKVKKTFKVDDFLACTDQNLTEQVTEWYKKRLKSIGNANEDANAIENEINNDRRDGLEGKKEVSFNQNPKYEDVAELPLIKNGSVVELVKITKEVVVTTEQVNGLWSVFKHQSLTGKKFYQDLNAVYSHFFNWIKIQKFDKGKLPYKIEEKTSIIPKADDKDLDKYRTKKLYNDV